MPIDLIELGERIGSKRGGIHKGDFFCGLYRSGSQIYLVKRDLNNPANDIAEYFSAALFAKTVPGYGAKVDLLAAHNHTYLISTYFDHYQDLYKCAGYEKRPVKQELAESLLPVNQYVKTELLKLDEQNNYLYGGYEKAIVTSLLIGDFSLHSGNLGVVSSEFGRHLVRVDFGASLRVFDAEIKPFLSIENRIGLEKNYLKRDHPWQRMFSRDFCAELNRVSQINLGETIVQEWKQIERLFCQDELAAFAQRINPVEQNLSLSDIDVFLCHRIAQRQAALAKIAWEIELALKIEFQEEDELIGFMIRCSPRELAAIKKLMLQSESATIAPFYAQEFQSRFLRDIFNGVESLPGRRHTFFEHCNVLQEQWSAEVPSNEDPIGLDWLFKY